VRAFARPESIDPTERSNRMKTSTGAFASLTVALALVLAGCSAAVETDTAPESNAADYNAADEMFVTGMIPHHEQALEMAEILLDKRGVDDRVVALAERIQAAQQPEIDLMSSWLTEWGVDSDMGDMPGMDHGDGGMMSDDDMAALEDASGADASSLFLVQMIDHHLGAIEMAEQELDNGRNADVLDLAQRIIDAQSAEIAEMQDLLAALR
jgi:uncharacterized protein (DUF305 family)